MVVTRVNCARLNGIFWGAIYCRGVRALVFIAPSIQCTSSIIIRSLGWREDIQLYFVVQLPSGAVASFSNTYRQTGGA